MPLVLTGGVTPDLHHLGLSCSPAQDQAAEGGGSAAKVCVGRCKEDACELPQGCAPWSTLSAGEGTPACGC